MKVMPRDRLCADHVPSMDLGHFSLSPVPTFSAMEPQSLFAAHQVGFQATASAPKSLPGVSSASASPDLNPCPKAAGDSTSGSNWKSVCSSMSS